MRWLLLMLERFPTVMLLLLLILLLMMMWEMLLMMILLLLLLLQVLRLLVRGRRLRAKLGVHD